MQDILPQNVPVGLAYTETNANTKVALDRCFARLLPGMKPTMESVRAFISDRKLVCYNPREGLTRIVALQGGTYRVICDVSADITWYVGIQWAPLATPVVEPV